MCKALEDLLSDDPEVEIVGKALSGHTALESLAMLESDVCTLDVQMPGMNGLTLLKHIMIRHPMPALMLSAFTGEGEEVTFDALRYGAVDFLKKPSRDDDIDLDSHKSLILAKIKRAANVHVSAAKYLRVRYSGGPKKALTEEEATFPKGLTVIGSSTGGYASLLKLFPAMFLPPVEPVLVVLGTPKQYMQGFVDYLQSYVPFNLERAKDQEGLKKGNVYFISSEETASLEREGDSLIMHLSSKGNMSKDESGLDLLLFSASDLFSASTLAVFLSGDKVEGLSGAKEVLRLGGSVMVQKPESCLSPELPNKIIEELNIEAKLLNALTENIQTWTERKEE
jgi:two-component system chemotaxis response regulator CheB